MDAALRARALRLLARREHSRAELARKLAPHASSPETLRALLDDLQARKQLSDERFAEARVRSLSSKFGAARIRHDLRSKGVAAALVAGLPSGDELERARAILARKYGAPPASFEERAKRARFLQGRGFPFRVIHDLLDVVEPQD